MSEILPTPCVLKSETHIFGEVSHEELLRRLEVAKEARKLATPKAAYVAALKAHCAECWPYRQECGAEGSCTLYPVRNPEARRGQRKKDLRRAIRDNCRDCVGTCEDLCTSPSCRLYPFRRGTLRKPQEQA